MMLTTAALLAIATALSVTGGTAAQAGSSDDLLNCAAHRYNAANALGRTKDATSLTATKGMGAIAPANRRNAEAARLRAEGDDFRRQAGGDLSRGDIAGRYPNAVCSLG